MNKETKKKVNKIRGEKRLLLNLIAAKEHTIEETEELIRQSQDSDWIKEAKRDIKTLKKGIEENKKEVARKEKKLAKTLKKN